MQLAAAWQLVSRLPFENRAAARDRGLGLCIPPPPSAAPPSCWLGRMTRPSPNHRSWRDANSPRADRQVPTTGLHHQKPDEVQRHLVGFNGRLSSRAESFQLHTPARFGHTKRYMRFRNTKAYRAFGILRLMRYSTLRAASATPCKH